MILKLSFIQAFSYVTKHLIFSRHCIIFQIARWRQLIGSYIDLTKKTLLLRYLAKNSLASKQRTETRGRENFCVIFPIVLMNMLKGMCNSLLCKFAVLFVHNTLVITCVHFIRTLLKSCYPILSCRTKLRFCWSNVPCLHALIPEGIIVGIF